MWSGLFLIQHFYEDNAMDTPIFQVVNTHHVYKVEFICDFFMKSSATLRNTNSPAKFPDCNSIQNIWNFE